MNRLDGVVIWVDEADEVVNVGTEGHCNHEESTLKGARVVVSGTESLSRVIAIHLADHMAVIDHAMSLIRHDNSNFIQQKMQKRRRTY